MEGGKGYMSNTVEQRTVEMRFDNSNFERNISQSQASLNSFNQNLSQLGGSRSGIGAFAATLKSITFDPINNGIEIGIGKLAALTVALTGISNLANDIYYKVTGMVKSLTFDQINAGFAKYSDKTTSVMTIMGAVRKEGETDEAVLARVNGQLEKLNWFTDETSYNFTDMVNNIGKFTSQGVELNDAVTAMQGIATWAAKSGGGVNEASRAMYNLSQVMGVGSLQTIDWKSIENANMGTKEFKELAIQIAATSGEMSTLVKKGDKYFTKKGNKEVNFQNFRDTLKEDWFSSDILMKVLKQYGSYADIVHDMQEKGETAAETMERLKEQGVEAENAMAAAAFKAAQEAKTFQEAIDATKDAVSTAFLNIFETLFGNYLEAKELWTDLANVLYDTFAQPVVDLADLLKKWKEMGGRTQLLNTIKKILDSISGIFEKLKDTWQEVFKPINLGMIKNFTNNFELFGNRVEKLSTAIKNNETVWENFKNFFEGLKAVVDMVKDAFNTIANEVFKNFGNNSMSVLEVFSKIVSKIGDLLKKFADFIQRNKLVKKALDILKTVLGGVYEAFKRLGEAIKNTLGNNDKNAMDTLSESAKSARGPLEIIRDVLSAILGFLGDIMESLGPTLASAWEFVTSIGSVLMQLVENILPVLQGLFTALSGVFKEVSERLKTFFDTADFTKPFEIIKNVFMKIGQAIGAVIGSIIEGISKFKQAQDSASKSSDKSKKDGPSFFQKIAEEIGLFADTLMKHKESIEWAQEKLFNNKDMGEVVMNFAEGLVKLFLVLGGGIAIIINIVRLINTARDKLFGKKGFIQSIINVPTMLGDAINGLTDTFKKLGGAAKQFTAAQLIKSIGQSILMLAGAFFIISLIPADKIAYSAGVIAGALALIVGAVTGLMIACGKIDKSANTGDVLTQTKGILGTRTRIGPDRLPSGLRNVVGLVIAIGAAVLMMAGAVAIIGNITGGWANALVGFGIVAALIGVLLAVVLTLQNAKIKPKQSKSLMNIAITMVVMSMAVKKIAKALVILSKGGDMEMMLASLAIIAGIFAFLLAFVGIASQLVNCASTFVTITGLMSVVSGMFIAIAIAVTILTRFANFEKMVPALISMGAMLTMIFTTLYIIGMTASKVTSGVQLGAMGVMAGMIAELAIVVIVIAAALRMLMIGSTGDDMLKACLGLVAIIGTMALVLALSTKVVKSTGDIIAMMAFAAAFAAFGLSLMAIVPAFKALQDVDAGKMLAIVGVIALLSAVLLAIGAIGGKFQFIITGLAGFAAVIALLGVASLIASAGIALIAEAFMTFVKGVVMLSVVGPAAGETIKGMMIGFAEGLVEIFKAIGLGIVEMLNTFVANKSTLLGMFGVLFSTIFEALLGIFPKIKALLINILDTLFQVLFTYGPKLNDFITTMVTQALTAIFQLLFTFGPQVNTFITTMVTQAIGDILGILLKFLKPLNDLITDTLIDIIHDINRLLIECIPDIVKTIVECTIEITKGVAEMTVQLTAIVLDGLNSLLSVLLEKLPEFTIKATALGLVIATSMIVGIVRGIAESIPVLIEGVADAFVVFVDKICKVLEEKTDDVYEAFVKLIETAFEKLGYWIGRMAAEGGIIRKITDNIIAGFVKGIKRTENEGKLKGAGIWMAQMLNLGTKSSKGLNEHSPSKVMFDNGQNAAQGLINGVTSKFSAVKNTGAALGSTLGGALAKAFEGMKTTVSGFGDKFKDMFSGISSGFDIQGMLSGITDINPTITPELDLSKLTKQAGGIDTLFANKQITAISDVNDWNSAQANLLQNQNMMDAAQSKEQMNGFMNMFSQFIDIEKYNANKPSNVNVTLQGDASKMLKVLKVEDQKQSKATGLRSLIRN